MNDYQIKHYKAPAAKARKNKLSAIEYAARTPEKKKEYAENRKAAAQWRDIVKNTKASYYGE